ncbi:MAG TPA: hypothetical protein VGE41_13370, partial [Verrucomicrobiae bacterium]
GFGSNFMNAMHCEGRLVLNNGTHRAYALRELGVKHVPCIVEHATSRDELEVIASSEVRAEPNLYLTHPRPSMLRDYFDERLRKIFPIHRRMTQLQIKFEVEEIQVPAF